MSVRGVLAVARMEAAKLGAQRKVSLTLAACAVLPFAFAAVVRQQSGLPEDTLFGRGIRASGLAVPLFVLGFAAQWALPALSGLVGGDIFSADDRYGTWKALLTRSRSRAEVFAGKVVAALGFSTVAVLALGASSALAGLLLVGAQPLLGLSGTELPAGRAAALVAVAWGSVLPPVIGFTALASLVSVATRSSAAGIGLPVVAGLGMELFSFVNGPEAARRLLLTSSFGAWHGLFAEPHFYGPLVRGTLVSSAYAAACLAAGWAIVRRRDIGG